MNKIWTISVAVFMVSVIFASSFVSSAEAKGKPIVDKTTGIRLVECSVNSSSLDCSFFTKDGIGIWLVSHPTGEETILLPADCLKKNSINLDPISEGIYEITVGECNAGDSSTFEIVISDGQIFSITLQ
jgi:hypothetical protein